MRLIDHVISKDWFPYDIEGQITFDTIEEATDWRSAEKEIKRAIRQSTIIVADNVDHFVRDNFTFTRTPDTHGFVECVAYFRPEDVPNLVPPFETFWIEWRGSGDLRAEAIEFLGCFVESERFTRENEDHPDGFTFLFHQFLLRHGKIEKSISCPAMESSALDGNLIRASFEGPEVLPPNVTNHRKTAQADGTTLHEFELTDDNISSLKPDIGVMNCLPAVVTISFMNCNNVKLRKIIIDPKRQKVAQKRTGVPLVNYHIIEITPMSRLIREEVRHTVPDKKFEKAMHIVRGHFKRYANKGLFGKVKGTFFFPAHQRGNPGLGETLKEYSINMHGKKEQP